MAFKPKEREYRSFGSFGVSESEEDALIVRGTPIVFDEPTCLYEIDGIKYFEKIARGALDEADMSDFIFSLNHELTPYARNKNGSLTYKVSDTQFDIVAELDKQDERHKQLHRDIQKRRIDKMSISFSIKESSYDVETHTRTITKIKKLYDVAAVTFPAYEQTSITARDFFSAEYEKEKTLRESERRRKEIILKTLL